MKFDSASCIDGWVKKIDAPASIPSVSRIPYFSPLELAVLDFDAWYWDKDRGLWYESDNALRERIKKIISDRGIG